MTVTELRAVSGLHLRELLLVENPAPLVQPRVLPRERCALLVVGAVRACVFVDRVWLFSTGVLPGARAFAASLETHVRVATSGPVWAEGGPPWC